MSFILIIPAIHNLVYRRTQNRLEILQIMKRQTSPKVSGESDASAQSACLEFIDSAFVGSTALAVFSRRQTLS